MSFLTQSHRVFFRRPVCLIPSTSHVIQKHLSTADVVEYPACNYYEVAPFGESKPTWSDLQKID